MIDKVRVGDDPNGIIYDPKTKRVFSADRGSRRMTAIDATTGKIAATSGDLGGGEGVLARSTGLASPVTIGVTVKRTLSLVRIVDPAPTCGDSCARTWPKTHDKDPPAVRPTALDRRPLYRCCDVDGVHAERQGR